MNILIGGCVAILTAAILYLLYAIWKTLQHAIAAIEEAKRTIGELREETKLTIGEWRAEALQLSRDASAVMYNMNRATIDVREKMKELDALFGTAREIGEGAHALASAVGQTAAGIADKVERAGRALEAAIAPSEESVAQVDRAAASPAGPTGRQTAGAAAAPQPHDGGGGAIGGKAAGTVAAITDAIMSSIRIWGRLRQQ